MISRNNELCVYNFKDKKVDYCYQDNKKYPESNKVLDKVFFIGAAPHYDTPVFDYIESVVKNFKYE
jgi:hypothetical protein